MNLAYHPIVYVLDDDADFCRLIEFALKKLGITVRVFTARTAFFKALSERKPSLCFVDLHMSHPNEGLEVLARIQSIAGEDVPIILVSASHEREVVAHALELGAADFLIKPLNREVFLAKLSQYLHSDQLTELCAEIPSQLKGAIRVFACLDLEITEIDELGVHIRSSSLISKGTTLGIASPLLATITGQVSQLLMTATNNWVDPDQKSYGAYLEFDHQNQPLLSAVRTWLLQG